MAESWDISLAKKFKERENNLPIGNIIGKVISPFPDIKISILDGTVVLTKDQLYCCEHVLNGYRREMKNIDTNEISTIEFIDTLAEGNLVLLIHTVNEQTWFILDKIKKL